MKALTIKKTGSMILDIGTAEVDNLQTKPAFCSTFVQDIKIPRKIMRRVYVLFTVAVTNVTEAIKLLKRSMNDHSLSLTWRATTLLISVFT